MDQIGGEGWMLCASFDSLSSSLRSKEGTDVLTWQLQLKSHFKITLKTEYGSFFGGGGATSLHAFPNDNNTEIRIENFHLRHCTDSGGEFKSQVIVFPVTLLFWRCNNGLQQPPHSKPHHLPPPPPFPPGHTTVSNTGNS